MGTLDGKVALVSGSGRGIGRAVAEKLAAEGARVVVNDLDKEAAQEVIGQLGQAGGEAVACVGSVTDPEFPGRFMQDPRSTATGASTSSSTTPATRGTTSSRRPPTSSGTP